MPNSSLIPIRIAQEIIRELHIRKPSQIEIEKIAAYYDVYMREDQLETCDARLLINTKFSTGIATINTAIPESGRKKFALAHELGHFKLHTRVSRIWECTEYDFLKWFVSTDKEAEANSFAAELLMPEEIFKNSCIGISPGFSNIIELSNTFRTSLTSTTIRYVEKGNYPCALVCSKEGKTKWFWTSDDFNCRLYEPGLDVHSDSCAAECFSNNDFKQDNPELVGTHCWIENYGNCDLPAIFEDTFVLRRYNTVLSLIWIK